MQKLLKQTRYAIALLSAVFLLGCVGIQLDTLNKKFVAFEISYKAALVQVDSLDKGNALKPENKYKILELIR